MKWFCLFFLIILIISSKNIGQVDSKISHNLKSKILMSDNCDSLNLWIYFKDKGPKINQELLKTKINLTKRSLQRRRKFNNSNIVDYYDIPLNDDYINEIKERIINVRQKSKWLNAVSAKVSVQNISKIESLSFVKKIDILNTIAIDRNTGILNQRSNREIEKFSSGIGNKFDYGPSFKQAAMLNIPQMHDLGFDGSGILICVCDGGFHNLNHEALKHLNILKTWDFINNEENVGQESKGDWGALHGTSVLGNIGADKEGQIISGAYGADYILARTESVFFERHLEEDAWVAAAEWADSLGADIITSSLGYLVFDNGEGNYTWENMDGNTAIITRASDIAASRGILVITGVGNSGPAFNGRNTLIAPADGDSVLAIGSCDKLIQRASYSSMGPTYDGRIKPDLVAMSTEIYGVDGNGLDKYFSGEGMTSGATPQVAAVAALVMQANPNLSNMEIFNLLRNTGSNAQTPNNEIGYGIANAIKAGTYFKPNDNISPDDFYLYQNYPNPFNQSTKIEYSIPREGLVNITVYDIIGKKVVELINEKQQKGSYQIRFDGSTLSSGVYFYRLRSNYFTDSKKPILLR